MQSWVDTRRGAQEEDAQIEKYRRKKQYDSFLTQVRPLAGAWPAIARYMPLSSREEAVMGHDPSLHAYRPQLRQCSAAAHRLVLHNWVGCGGEQEALKTLSRAQEQWKELDDHLKVRPRAGGRGGAGPADRDG